MAGALPEEEYKNKLERAGFHGVNIKITAPHELNLELIKSSIHDLTEDDLKAMEGLSASALITALKPRA